MTAYSEKLRRARPLLGTLVEISLTGEHELVLNRAADADFGAIDRIHRLMSFHSESSDVTRLNRGAARRPVEVDPHTLNVLLLAEQVARVTEGIFDITIGGKMMARGALPRMAHGCWDTNVSYRDIELLPGRRVRFRRALAVDVGGIAKGYAVDCAIEALRAFAGVSGCVNAGGDLRVVGTEAVPVHVRNPQNPACAAAIVQLRACALATTASYPAGARNAAGLVLDPRASSQSHACSSASVRASSCALADALAKSVYLLRERAGSMLAQFGASGFLLDRDGLSLIGATS